MGALKALKRALTNSGLLTKESVAYIEDDVLMKAIMHPDAHEEGGLACNDKELLEEMRACIMEWVKSMGRQILTGNLNLVNTSFPVEMFEARSYLQKLSDVWAYPQLLSAAATCRDPLERMKLMVTFVVAGSHKGFESWKKPFNPILGETWQATMPGGISLYMEQVSHHPPVSAYSVEGPQGAWSFSGWSQPAVAPVVKWYGIRTMARGARQLHCADGSVLELHMPHFAIKGVVYASRPRAEVIGTAHIIDAANCLEAVLHFGPVEGTRHRVLERPDAVVGEIYKVPRRSEAGRAGHEALQSVVLSRTATAPLALSNLDEHLNGQVQLATGSSSDGVDAEDEAVFNAVQDKLGSTPADVNIDIASASGCGSSCSASPLPSPSPPVPAGRPPPTAAAAGHAQVAPRVASETISIFGGRKQQGSTFWGGSSKQQPEVPGVACAYIEGSWLSHLNIDNKRYWTWSEEPSSKWQPVADPLPSDVRYRADLAALAAGDKAAAAEWKTRLEQQQRADKKLREAAGVFESH